MRIKGLGGKKLAILWKTAGIDSMDALLKACKNDEVSKIEDWLIAKRTFHSAYSDSVFDCSINIGFGKDYLSAGIIFMTREIV